MVLSLKDKYEAAVEELDHLIEKRNEQRKKELLEAIEASDKTLDEIFAFLKSEKEDE